MSTRLTFWQLLNNYEVVIPIIQRDYAQGRKDPRTTQVRETFVRDLSRVFTDRTANIDLDYIYGSNASDKLVLLDGQQRITTLFLLYWYVANQTGNLDSAKERLSRFGYETRFSSEDFCASLIKNGISNIPDNKMLSDCIKDTQWFHFHWKHDPTVQSMLVMLDAFHEKLKGNLEVTWNRLIDPDHPAISFYFLNMTDFNLTDELYIKMNARGRVLSDFENFKAWLIDYAANTDDIRSYLSGPYPKWQNRLDMQWTDLFWQHRPSDVNEIDGLLLKYFKGMAFGHYAEMQKPGNQSENLELIRRFHSSKEYISTREYERIECFNGQSLEEMFKVLDYFSNGSSDSSGKESMYTVTGDEKRLFESFISSEPRYEDRTLFYALTQFIVRAKPVLQPDKEKEQLSRWLRVLGNLIRYTSITAENYISPIHSIKNLAERAFNHAHGPVDVYSAFSRMKADDITFSKRQRDEEILK
jgi:hypothetical protein